MSYYPETRRAYLDMDDQELKIGGTAVTKTAAQLNAEAAAIADVTVTGTYADDDDAIETAINSILAALRTAGIVAAE